MKIELKNVKHAEFASHETNCFEATIYIDGKRAGTAHNEGYGGTTSIYPNTLYLSLTEYAKTLPPTKYQDYTFDQDAESVIDNLLTAYLYARDLKKAMSKRIIYRRAGQLLQTIKMDAPTLSKQLARPDLKDKLNAEEVLNLLPMDKAVSIYRELVAA